MIRVRNLSLPLRLYQRSFKRAWSAESSSAWLFDEKHTIFNKDVRIGISVDRMGHLSQSSVVASSGGSIVHVAVNGQAPAETGEDFLPLTVDYRARMSAFGKIPDGSRRREKSPGSDDEILVARFIDRAIRPQFPSGFVDEVQVTVTNHSTDGVHDPTVLALNATSFALLRSNIPWFGPVGCVRVGYIDDKLVVNPAVNTVKNSKFDLLYAGTLDRTLMIEAVGAPISESIVKEAIALAQEATREIIELQRSLLSGVRADSSIKNTQKKSGHVMKPEHLELVETLFGEKAKSFYLEPWSGKEDRSKAEGILRSTILEEINQHSSFSEESPLVRGMLTDYIISKSFRSALLQDVPVRSDGRDLDKVRQVECAIGVLPETHGSAYFSRGDTHVLSSVTLGKMEDCRETVALDGSDNEKKDYFYLHYDFPPYCNGEVGMLTLNRRMVGHGNLAERALRGVVPSFQNFPYTVRIMAECTSSNGSSSMASVCSGTMALLNAGVPISDPVAGVSVGLVTDPSFAANAEEFATGAMPSTGKYRILTDILGSEDHHGDMDFKIAGTKDGITAIQLDVKLRGGIPLGIIGEALDAGKDARLSILKKMEPYVNRRPLSYNAPLASLFPVDLDRMSHLLANGGEILKFITRTYDVEVKITDDNHVYVYGTTKSVYSAVGILQDIATTLKEGTTVQAVVNSVKDFGVFVRVNHGQEALLHVSHISHDNRITKTPLEEIFKKGDTVNVKITAVDKITGLVTVSRKVLMDPSVEDELFTKKDTPEVVASDDAYLPEEFSSINGKFPVTPPRKWNPEYFKKSVADPNSTSNSDSSDKKGNKSQHRNGNKNKNKKNQNNNNKKSKTSEGNKGDNKN